MSVLVFVEHDNASMKDATLAAVTAAGKLGEVHVLVAGSGCGAVADQVAKVAGVTKVHVADDAAYANQLAENVAPLIAGLMGGFDAAVFPATSHGKNIAPRVAALLDVMQISDILSVESADTFTRPIYAGNAIATVQSSDAKKVITFAAPPLRRQKPAAVRQASRPSRVAAMLASPASSEAKSPSRNALS
jgi:electron transfer flavoprotein alpha subunit